MAIVDITIDTYRLGDTPEVKIDGKKINVLDHIDFDWTTSKESAPSISKLNIKHWPNYIPKISPVDLNEVVMHDSTWKTALHRSVNNEDGD